MSRDNDDTSIVALGFSILALLKSASASVGQFAGQAMSALGIVDPGIVIHMGGGVYRSSSIQDGTATTVANRNGVTGDPQINVSIGNVAGTVAAGNDNRLPPAPSVPTIGQMLFDSGTEWIRRFLISSDIPQRLIDKVLVNSSTSAPLVISEVSNGTTIQRTIITNGRISFTSNANYNGTVYVKDVAAQPAKVVEFHWTSISQWVRIMQFTNSDVGTASFTSASPTTLNICLDSGAGWSLSTTNSFPQTVAAETQLKSAIAGDRLYVTFPWVKVWTPTAPTGAQLSFTSDALTTNVTLPTAPFIERSTATYLLVSFPVTANGDARWIGTVSGWNN